MKIGLAQTEASKGDFDRNFENALTMAQKLKAQGAELAVFPEMFLTGFNYGRNKNSLESGADFILKVSEIAKSAGLYTAGSVPSLAQGDGKPSNRMVFAAPDGRILEHYDKIHLFGLFREDRHVEGGKRLAVAETPFGKIGFAVCYDLRFPELFLNLVLNGAEMIIVSSAWPHPRMEHIKLLARARAIECQCFMACVNQAGTEELGPNQIPYGGESCVVDPWGNVLCSCKPDEPDTAVCEIDISKVAQARREITALADRRPQFYKI